MFFTQIYKKRNQKKPTYKWGVLFNPVVSYALLLGNTF